MIEIDEKRFCKCGSLEGLYDETLISIDVDLNCLREQLYAQMLGWA